MTYQKLSENTKKAITKNAKEYTAKNYIQKNIKLKPEVAEKLENLCKKREISCAKLIEEMINIYK